MSERLPLTIVVAVGSNRGIGRRGALPWRIAEDLKHFKASTLGHAIIMGRKTYESIGKPLPGRRNIVVSRTLASHGRSLGDAAEDAVPPFEVYDTLEQAIAEARTTDPEPRIIGGGAIYEEAMAHATELLVTSVDEAASGDLMDCDAFFPAIDLGVFELVSQTPFETAGVSLLRYLRKS